MGTETSVSTVGELTRDNRNSVCSFAWPDFETRDVHDTLLG